jgi:hypothetical protein
MLKINLLPSYIYERKKIRVAWATVVAVVLLEIVALAAFQAKLINDENAKAAEVTEAETHAQRVQKLVTDAQNEKAKIAPITQKVQFIKDILKFNLVRPNLFQNAAEYTLKGIRYSHMEASGNVLTIQATAPTLSAMGRYLIYMQGNPDFTAVQIAGGAGYPPGNQNEGAGISGASSSYGGSSSPSGPPGYPGGPAGGAIGGPPGGPPGMYGGPPGGPGGYGGPSGSAPVGYAGAPGGSGGPGGYGGPGGPGGYGGPGGTTDTGGQLPGLQAALGGTGETWGGRWYNTRARLVPQDKDFIVAGYPFTVTATLVEPINRPVYGQSAATDTSGGYGGGGYGGYPGGPYGSPGGPPGSPAGRGGGANTGP